MVWNGRQTLTDSQGVKQWKEMKMKEDGLICLKWNARKWILVFTILAEISCFAEMTCRSCGDALNKEKIPF